MKIIITITFILFLFSISNSQVVLSPWVGFNVVTMKYKNIANKYNNIFLGNNENTYSFGTNFSVPIAMKNTLYAGVGISYIENNVRFAFSPDVDGIDKMQSILKWRHSYSQVGFPLYLRKIFFFDNDRKNNLSVQLGLSLGVNFESLSSFSAVLAKSERNNDVVISNVGGFLNNKILFMPSFIGGFDVAPFKGFRSLKFGISTSLNLLQNPEFNSFGYFENSTLNIRQNAEIKANPVFYNVIFSIKYDIVLKKRKTIKLTKFKHEDINY